MNVSIRVRTAAVGALLVGLAGLAGGGCAGPVDQTAQMFRSVDGLSEPRYNADLRAVIIPPDGWTHEVKPPSKDNHHELWISPDKSTAYGIVRMELPFYALPVGERTLLDKGVLDRARQTEGQVELDGPVVDDPKADGIRFVMNGKFFRTRAVLMKRGLTAWMVYAGTVQDKPLNEAALKPAELARDRTAVNVGADGKGAGAAPTAAR